jgi:YHS domain-containing protein
MAQRRIVVVMLCLATVALMTMSFKSTAPAKWQINTDQGGLAIKGYDPVAYFILAKPVKGREEFSVEWNGARWLFMNRQHLEMFRQSPERYAPRYGGYCAWAVSHDHRADIEVDAWSIHGDRLYLNYSKNIRAKWSRNISRNIKMADENWRWMLKEQIRGE